jgi:hypothetical protein
MRPGGWVGGLNMKDKLLLRYRSVLEEKHKKLETYRTEGIIASSDAVLIAVSQGAIDNSDLEDIEVPALAQAVFPIGEPVMRITPYRKGPHPVEVPRRELVTKSNGCPVSTTFFLEPCTAIVSGILFSAQSVGNSCWRSEDSLGLVHRPDATVPLPRGSIPTRCELWVEEEVLQHRGRCARYGTYAHDPTT